MQAILFRARRWSFKSFLLYCPHPTSPTSCTRLGWSICKMRTIFIQTTRNIIFCMCKRSHFAILCRMLKYRFLQDTCLAATWLLPDKDVCSTLRREPLLYVAAIRLDIYHVTTRRLLWASYTTRRWFITIALYFFMKQCFEEYAIEQHH